jgi:hypothetical protein
LTSVCSSRSIARPEPYREQISARCRVPDLGGFRGSALAVLRSAQGLPPRAEAGSVYLSLQDERTLAAEATDRLDADHGLSQPAVAANLARFRRPNPTPFWLHRHTWEQLDRYARGIDRATRERLTGVIATYLALMVRRHGSEWAARRAHEANALPGA